MRYIINDSRKISLSCTVPIIYFLEHKYYKSYSRNYRPVANLFEQNFEVLTFTTF